MILYNAYNISKQYNSKQLYTYIKRYTFAHVKNNNNNKKKTKLE